MSLQPVELVATQFIARYGITQFIARYDAITPERVISYCWLIYMRHDLNIYSATPVVPRPAICYLFITSDRESQSR